MAHGASPGAMGRRVWEEVLSSPYGLSQVVFRATPLLLTGLAVATAFQAGLFNIGAEGQAVVGSLALGWVGWAAGGLPALALWPLALGAAVVAGGIWGGIPGWLKARFGTHEVINTIMLNFIAMAASNYLLSRHLALPESMRTPDVARALWLPRLSRFWTGSEGSPANVSFFIAIVLAVGLHFFLRRTRYGFLIRVCGRGPRAAAWAGVDVRRTLVFAMVASGALAALSGLNGVLGYKHCYEAGMTGGVGYLGIGVALLARNEPLHAIPSALLFGFLSYTGLAISGLVPKEAVDVLTGAVLLFVILADRWRRRVRSRRPAGDGAGEGTAPEGTQPEATAPERAGA